MMFTQAISANGLIDQNNNEKRSNQLLITEKLFVQNFQQKLSAAFNLKLKRPVLFQIQI